MLFLLVVQHYLLWHYSRAFLEIWHVWQNFLWFCIHFFSIPNLIRHWFAPYKRIVEDRKKAWDLEDIAGHIIIGFFSRLIGGLIRSVILLLGFICLLGTVVLGIIVYILWLAAPLLILALLSMGIGIILL